MTSLASKYNFMLLVLLLIIGRTLNSCLGNVASDCNIRTIFDCVANISNLYGFNLRDPEVQDRLPNLDKTQFVQLCKDYILMLQCLNDNKPCDYRGMMYAQYGYALANGLNYACQKDVLDGYDRVVKCRQTLEAQAAERGCQTTLFKDIKALVNETMKQAEKGRIDVSVTVETVCKMITNSIMCSKKKLLSLCGQLAANWYQKVMLDTIMPILKNYRCQLEWKVSDIIILFFVCLAGTAVIIIVIYICVQRYRSFMSSKMNFVVSYIPKATQRIRKFAPSIIQRVSSKLSSDQTISKRSSVAETDAKPESGQDPQPSDAVDATANRSSAGNPVESGSGKTSNVAPSDVEPSNAVAPITTTMTTSPSASPDDQSTEDVTNPTSPPRTSWLTWWK